MSKEFTPKEKMLHHTLWAWNHHTSDALYDFGEANGFAATSSDIRNDEFLFGTLTCPDKNSKASDWTKTFVEYGIPAEGTFAIAVDEDLVDFNDAHQSFAKLLSDNGIPCKIYTSDTHKGCIPIYVFSLDTIDEKTLGDGLKVLWDKHIRSRATQEIDRSLDKDIDQESFCGPFAALDPFGRPLANLAHQREFFSRTALTLVEHATKLEPVIPGITEELKKSFAGIPDLQN